MLQEVSETLLMFGMYFFDVHAALHLMCSCSAACTWRVC